MYVFVGVLAGTVGAADNTLWRILSGAPGWAHGFKMTGYVRPEIGDLENDPYGDSQRHKKIPLQ